MTVLVLQEQPMPMDTTAHIKLHSHLIRLGLLDSQDIAYRPVVEFNPVTDKDEDRVPTLGEIRASIPDVREAFRTVQPKWVLLLGAVPARIFSSFHIKQIHGRLLSVKRNSVTGPMAMPVFNPEAAVRDKRLGQALVADLTTFVAMVKSGNVTDFLDIDCVVCGETDPTYLDKRWLPFCSAHRVQGDF